MPSGVTTQPEPGSYGYMVRVARSKLGLDQKQLAERIGASQADVTDVETGKKTFKRDRAVALYRLAYGWLDWENLMEAERLWERQNFNRIAEAKNRGGKRKR